MRVGAAWNCLATCSSDNAAPVEAKPACTISAIATARAKNDMVVLLFKDRRRAVPILMPKLDEPPESCRVRPEVAADEHEYSAI